MMRATSSSGSVICYNRKPDELGAVAVKIIRGAANGRYVSGFEFRHMAAVGFAAAVGFQGMNVENAGLNYFGNVVFDSERITAQSTQLVSIHNVLKDQAVMQERLNTMDKRIDELRHGRGFVRGTFNKSVDAEYS